MSYSWGNSINNYLSRAASLISNTDPRPISLGFRLKCAATTARQWIYDNNKDGDPPYGVSVSSGTTATLDLYTAGAYNSSSSFTNDATNWHSYLVTWATGSPGAVAYYRDGAAIGTASVTLGAAGGTVTGAYIGVLMQASGLAAAGFLINGSLGEFCVWNAILDAAEAAAFTNGASGLLIRRSAIRAYLPLNNGVAQDLYNGSWTITGTHTKQADHPRITYLTGPLTELLRAGPGYPLDFYKINLSAAWDYRRLLSSYTGPLIRVRRLSDNAEQDIGYTSTGALDETAMTTFVSSSSGYVTVIYDQSGGTRHLGLLAGASWPRIVNAGTVDKLNGKPCGTVTLADYDFLATTTLFTAYTGKPLAAIWAGRITASSGSDRVFSVALGAGADYASVGSACLIQLDGSGTSVGTYSNNITYATGLTFTANTAFAVSARFDGTTETLRNAGGQVTAAFTDNWNFTRIAVGGECAGQSVRVLGLDSFSGTGIFWFADPGATIVETVRAEAEVYWGGGVAAAASMVPIPTVSPAMMHFLVR